MRLFVAVNFDEVTKSRLLAVQEQIKAQAIKGNFTRPENLHLTLLFIGEVTADLKPVITGIIKNAVNTAITTQPKEITQKSLSLSFNNTGFFKRAGKELWWIGLDSKNKTTEEILVSIRQKIGSGLNEAGIHYDRRQFRAHITLGREIKPAALIKAPECSICIQVKRISLMKSENLRGILNYAEVFGMDLFRENP